MKFNWFGKKEQKEPNHCIACTRYYPDTRMLDKEDQCRFAKCSATIEGKVNPILLVCPDFNVDKALNEEMGYCTIKRRKVGEYCKDYVPRKD